MDMELLELKFGFIKASCLKKIKKKIDDAEIKNINEKENVTAS